MLRSVILFLLIGVTVDVNAQRDTVRKDTFQLPSIVFKTSVDPGLFLLNPINANELCVEMRLARVYSFEVGGGIRYRNPLWHFNSHPHGYFFNSMLKRYISHRNALFIGLNYQFYHQRNDYTATFFPSWGTYSLRTRATRDSQIINLFVGGSGTPSGFRFFFELYAGPGIEIRNTTFTNLNTTELEMIRSKQSQGLEEEFPGRKMRFYAAIGLRIGFNPKGRKVFQR